MKISILGMGRVGTAIAFALTYKGIPDELVLVTRNRAVAEAEAQDLTHASAFSPHLMTIRDGSIEDTANSAILIQCVSVPWGEQYRTRHDLAVGNAAIFREQIPQLATLSPNCVMIIVTNPVDAMTYCALKLSGFAPQKVIGTGTLLDSARYRTLLSREMGIHPDDIRAYILGEHGESQFPALSVSLTAGQRIDTTNLARRVFNETVKSGYQIIAGKGHTNYAIALSVTLMVESIARDERRTMPVSTLIHGYCNVEDVCLSVPCVVGREGVLAQLQPHLSQEETEAFQKSAATVRKTIDALQNL